MAIQVVTGRRGGDGPGFGLWTHDAFERGTIGGGRSLSSSSLATNRPAADSGVKSSALFRFGFSYAGGFLIGWLFRKSLKLALLAAGAVALAVAAGKYFGLFNLDWAAIEAHTAQSLAWLKGELGALKDFLTGYLPSAIVGFLGLLKGARLR